MENRDHARNQTTSIITQSLENTDLRRWYTTLARSSPATAEVRLRRLTSFCRMMSVSPSELVKKDPVTIADILDDCVTMMEAKGYSGGYIKSTMTGVKSWLAHFSVTPGRKIRVRNADVPTTLSGEKVPDGQELAEILQLGDLRARAVKQLIAKAGIRPGVLGDYTGSDGLKLGDLPDLALTQGTAIFLRQPARLIVRAPLSKTRRQYQSFITTSAASALCTYLNDRFMTGEDLGQESPVISPYKAEVSSQRFTPQGTFLCSSSIRTIVRESMRPRFSQRPYVLRAYFDTQLLHAEAKGLVTRDFRVYWMGHKGSIDAVYTTGKQSLPESIIEEMREAFRRAEPFLDLERFQDPSEKQRQEIQTKVARMAPDALGRVLKLINGIGGKTTA